MMGLADPDWLGLWDPIMTHLWVGDSQLGILKTENVAIFSLVNPTQRSYCNWLVVGVILPDWQKSKEWIQTRKLV